MNTPLVTVIITSYNQEDFIGEALESVTGQDYESLEILACDDASTDGTLAILHDWSRRDSRVRVIDADENTGLSENRNRGLRVSAGEYIALLDGDDLMRPGKIRAQVERLQAEPAAAGCVHDAEVFQSEDGRRLGLTSRSAGVRGLREGGVELWLNPTYAVLPSTMMFRARFVPAHLFDKRLPFTADWLFSIELFRRGRCVVLDGIYVDYRRHAAQMTTDSAKKGFEEGLMIMGIVDARYPELRSLTRAMRAALLLGEARRRTQAGDRPGMARYVKSALRAGGIAGNLRVLLQLIEAKWARAPALGRQRPIPVDDALGLNLDARPDTMKQFEERMIAASVLDSRPEMSRRANAMRSVLLRSEARRRMRSGERSAAVRFARSAAYGRGLLDHVRLLYVVVASRSS